jgi:hypothetical protein
MQWSSPRTFGGFSEPSQADVGVIKQHKVAYDHLLSHPNKAT